MFFLNILIMALCLRQLEAEMAYDYERLHRWRHRSHIPTDLMEIMKAYYEETVVRIVHINEMRFMYEETPQYEIGYIIGEIIERYKKMVEHGQRLLKYKNEIVPVRFKHLRIVQLLWFEIYHLVRMVHEIPLKYGDVKEFEDPAKKKITFDIEAQKKQMQMDEKTKHKAKKKWLKLNQKLREQYLEASKWFQPDYSPNKAPKHWPIDYGWEINNWN